MYVYVSVDGCARAGVCVCVCVRVQYACVCMETGGHYSMLLEEVARVCICMQMQKYILGRKNILTRWPGANGV